MGSDIFVSFAGLGEMPWKVKDRAAKQEQKQEGCKCEHQDRTCCGETQEASHCDCAVSSETGEG